MANERTLVAQSQLTSRLLSLADELILNIIEQIDGIQALRNFVLTCQKAQGMAEPYLYRDLVFYDGDAVMRYFMALDEQPDRGKHAQYLDVRYKVDGRKGIVLLNGMSRWLPNLRSWRIETPCPNDNLAFSMTGDFGSGAGILEYWHDVPRLHHLQSIRIHTHVRGDISKNYFDLSDGQGAIIFKSPSLKHIFLSCTDITAGSVRILKDCAHKTPLETLEFEECNISTEALKMILARPKALKRLTLGERLHHFHDPTSGYLPESGVAFVEALAQQAESLEYLKQTQQLTRVLLHWTSTTMSERRSIFALPSEIPDFQNLAELDVPYASPLQSVAARFPPKLEKIRIHHFHEHLPAAAIDAITRELGLFERSSLKHLEIVLMEVRTDREGSEDEWLEELVGPESHRCVLVHEWKRADLWNCGNKLRKMDIRLTVNWVRSAGYIPPFMHGEILPTEFTIYDSNSPDLFGHIPSGNFIRDADCERRLRKEPHGPNGGSPNWAEAGSGDDEEFADDAYAFM